MRLGRSYLTIPAVLCVTAFLTACATQPTVRYIPVGSQYPAGGNATFSIVPAQNTAAKQAADLVKQKLESLGYTRSASADYLVEVSTTRRSAGTGAFVPQKNEMETALWLEQPEVPSGKTRKIAETLRVRFLVRETGAPVLVATSSLVTSNASLTRSSGELVDAMFATDPLQSVDAPASLEAPN